MNVLTLVQELEDRLYLFYFLIEPRDEASRKVKDTPKDIPYCGIKSIVLGYADGIDLMVEKRKGLKALPEKSQSEVSQGRLITNEDKTKRT